MEGATAETAAVQTDSRRLVLLAARRPLKTIPDAASPLYRDADDCSGPKREIGVVGPIFLASQHHDALLRTAPLSSVFLRVLSAAGLCWTFFETLLKRVFFRVIGRLRILE
ncbi:hypothetical protein MRX96_035732 [Rhipicephalus microplus]